MNYRNKALIDSAKDETCIFCGSGYQVVWSHSNEPIHGAHDLLGLYLCAEHHYWYNKESSPKEARHFFRQYYPLTMVRVAEKLARGELKL